MEVVDKYYGDNDDFFVMEGEFDGRAIRVLTTSDMASCQGGVFLGDGSTYGKWGFPGLVVEGVVATDPDSVLMLGGGPMRVYSDVREAVDGVRVLTVEEEPCVVQAANQYFGYRYPLPSEGQGVVYGDAEEVVADMASYGRFDVAIVDLFNGSRWPAFMGRQEFWRNLARMVEGEVFVNYNALSKQELPDVSGWYEVEFDEGVGGSGMFTLKSKVVY